MLNAQQASGDAQVDEAPLLLRGTNRGLEIVVQKEVQAHQLAELLIQALSKSPDFFAGGDALIHFAKAPLPGTISALEAVTSRFQIRLIGVYSAQASAASNEAPAPRLSQRRPRTASTTEYPQSVTRFAPPHLQANPSPDLAQQESPSQEPPTLIAGPIRSGTTIESPGHLIVFGDVNPGAEICAGGNIVVLGSLRGIAHAGCTGQPAFIIALTLLPQQLRIDSLVARAGDADGPVSGAEIAYIANNMIVVEPYRGRLPMSMATIV